MKWKENEAKDYLLRSRKNQASKNGHLKKRRKKGSEKKNEKNKQTEKKWSERLNYLLISKSQKPDA